MTKIRSRILISSFVIIMLFMASALTTVFFNQRGIGTASMVQTELLPQSRRLEEIALSLVTTQRWILDAALTGDTFGLDQADRVYGDLRQHIKNLEKDSSEEKIGELESLLDLANGMYNAGLDMFDAFADGDGEEGYYLLEDFGAIAEEASDYVNDLRTEASDQVSLSIFNITSGLQFIDRISIAAIIASVIFSSLFAFYSTSSISRPIEKLCAIALSVAEGQLDQTIPQSKYVEIMHLSTSLNSLLSSLSGVISKIQIVSEEVTRGSGRMQEGLAASTEETQAAMTEIGTNLDSIRTQTVSLENMVRELKISAQQISETAESLENQVERQVSVVSQSSASVEQLIRSIENVTRTTHARSESALSLKTVLETGREKLSASSETARMLGEYIERMNSITKLISAVSGKSSLLSMNAAIEAAHAGKQGLGFSVVADEMRKLSEDTNKNAVLIRDIINQAVAQIQELTDETSQASNAFNAIGSEVNNVLVAMAEIDNTMVEMSSGSTEIAQAVSNLSEVSARVSMATESMRAVSDSVERNVISTDEISTQVLQAVSEIGIGTKDVQGEMISIFERVREVIEDIAAIHSSVSHFTLAG